MFEYLIHSFMLIELTITYICYRSTLFCFLLLTYLIAQFYKPESSDLKEITHIHNWGKHKQKCVHFLICCNSAMHIVAFQAHLNLVKNIYH